LVIVSRGSYEPQGRESTGARAHAAVVVIPRSTASVEFHDRAVTVSCE
jgi:hypothetical protein